MGYLNRLILVNSAGYPLADVRLDGHCDIAGGQEETAEKKAPEQDCAEPAAPRGGRRRHRSLGSRAVLNTGKMALPGFKQHHETGKLTAQSGTMTAFPQPRRAASQPIARR